MVETDAPIMVTMFSLLRAGFLVRLDFGELVVCRAVLDLIGRHAEVFSVTKLGFITFENACCVSMSTNGGYLKSYYSYPGFETDIVSFFEKL